MPNIELNDIKGLLVHNSDIKTITRNNIVIWQGGFNFNYTGEFIYNGVTYSNTSLNIDEEDFEVMFTSSGIFTPSAIFSDKTYRAFLVGGGGAGGHGRHTYPTRGGSVGGGGGAGGYNTTGNISISEGSPYEIIIGEGGQSDSARGGTTSAFGLSAEGGYGGNIGNPTGDNEAYQAARQSGGTGYGGKSSYCYMTWWWEGWWNRNFRAGENGGNGVQAFGRGDYLYGAGGAGGSGSEMNPSFASIYSGGTNGGGNGINAFTTKPATATGYGAGGAGGNGGFKQVEDEYEYGDSSGGFGHSGIVILTSY